MISYNQYRAIMAITSCFETDDPVGKYDLISVLEDGAGISYGRHQATENGGALYQVITRYIERGGAYAEALAEYLPQLYDGVATSRKDALTNNADFRELLIQAAQDDSAMRRAQDDVFNRDYYVPAVELCNAWQIHLPLGVAMAYGDAIQYGPATLRNLWEYWETGFDPNSYEPGITIDPTLSIELQNQMRTVHYLNTQMRQHRASSSKEAVRKTVYRSDTILRLMGQQNWMLVPPFDVQVAYRDITITLQVLDRLP